MLFDLPPLAWTEPALQEAGGVRTDDQECTAHGTMGSHRAGTGMFGAAPLKEAIDLLPLLPDTESLDEVRRFLRSNLHFSAEDTRQRYASYAAKQVFPDGYADRPLRDFAGGYAGTQALRDACFYRFCRAEPLVLDVLDQVFLPAIGLGQIGRERLRGYLQDRFPLAGNATHCSKAIVRALVDTGLATADRSKVSFGYRDILIPSFAFVLHSEFSQPGMYDIAGLENNRAIRAMLWDPDRLLPSLYELRNLSIVAKVSEIDRVRQFTTKWTLAETVERLVAGRDTP